MRHTQGPWGVSGLPIGGPNEAITADGPVVVALLPRRGEAGTRGEVEPNARLIAACPTMYDYICGRAETGDECAQAIIAGIDA